MTRTRAVRNRPTAREATSLAVAFVGATGLLLAPIPVAHVVANLHDPRAWGVSLAWLALTATAAVADFVRPAPHALIPGDRPDQALTTSATRGGR